MLIDSLIPYLHVADVLRSQHFYECFGMTCTSRFGPEGEPYWARMQSRKTDLMLARASGPIDPRVQAAMLYMHTPDLPAVRANLLQGGCVKGGAFQGDRPDLHPPTGMLFELTYPDWMPDGEMRVHDPDGYVILVGQLDSDED